MIVHLIPECVVAAQERLDIITATAKGDGQLVRSGR